MVLFKKNSVNIKLLLMGIALFTITGFYPEAAHSITNPVDFFKGNIAVGKADREYDNKNYKDAFYYYKKSAEAGSGYGQFMLANMYLAGEGVRKNVSKYMYWINKSADNGYPSACYLFGVALLYKDPGEAMAYLKKAARKEHGAAMHMLGLMHAKGVGTEVNTREALKWFRLAHAQGVHVKKQWLSEKGITESFMVYEIQERLTQLGYNPGPVDGIYGKKTAAGISRFQKNTGMRPDGKASKRLLEILRKRSN